MTAPPSDTPAISPPLGTVLGGKYTLDEVLGRGGMATVFAATHRNGGRFAIKVLHPQLAAEPSIRGRFLREGYAANRVGHAGALRVLDDDVTPEGNVYLVLELLEGETVARRFARSGSRLPVDEVLAVAHQTLDVLAVAHERGIVHRDIKPENLFVRRGGAITVLDFGIARLRETGSAAIETQSGIAIGTPAFMAPEQALGKTGELDGRTDLYALGATLFQLLTGRFVHQGETPQEIAAYAATRPAPRLASVVPDIAPSVAALVDGALQFEKGKRWESAALMRAKVEAAHRAAFGRAMIESGRPSLTRRPPADTHRDVTAIRNAETRESTLTGTRPSTGETSLTSSAVTGEGGRRGRRALPYIVAAGLGVVFIAALFPRARGRSTPQVGIAAHLSAAPPISVIDAWAPEPHALQVKASSSSRAPPEGAGTTLASPPASTAPPSLPRVAPQPRAPARLPPAPSLAASSTATNPEDMYRP